MKGSWGLFFAIALMFIWQPRGCSSDQDRTLRQAVIDYVDRLNR